MPEVTWEEVKQNFGGHMARAKVPGGWLVRLENETVHFDAPSGSTGGWGDFHVGLTFVPDPKHKWGNESSDSIKRRLLILVWLLAGNIVAAVAALGVHHG